MSQLATPGNGQIMLNLEGFRAAMKKPLRLLPESVRPAALQVWTCNRHLAGLESPLPLAARMSVWIERHGLQADDAADCLNELLAPDSAAKHRFASDLLCELARLANARILRRRSEAEVLKRRQGPSPTKRAEVDRLISGLGSMPGTVPDADVPARPLPADPSLDSLGREIPF